MTELDPHIPAIRRFNRFYTQTIGALSERYLDGPYSLAELRILHEIGHNEGITATLLAERLSMDHGFLSRKLAELTQKRLVKRTRSATDKRQLHLSLSATGAKQLPKLEEAANTQVEQMLAPLPPSRRFALVSAMKRVHSILRSDASGIVFRQLAPGDAGWIVHRHGTIIAPEFGWNMEFEALCAQILSDFINNYQPEWERSWIVERDGEVLGSLFLVRLNETTAKLRLLYVDPNARGLGLATKLLDKAIQFARSKHYTRMTLFTTSSNTSARRIYDKLGMQLTLTEPLDFAGQSLTGETWEMAL